MRQSEWTAEDIAQLLGLSERAVRKRAGAEKWPSTHQKTRGGYQSVYVFGLLPSDIRTAIGAKLCAKPGRPRGESARAGAECGSQYRRECEEARKMKQMAMETGLSRFNELPEARQKEAQAKFEILQARDAFCHAARLPLKKGSQAFALELKAGRIRLSDDVMAALSRPRGLSVSWSTLVRWKQAYEADGLYGLAGKYKSRAGETYIPGPQRQFIEAMKVEHPHVSIPYIKKSLEARFSGQEIPHTAAVRRYVARWEKENASLLLYLTNPDEWKNRNMLAAGQADEQIERLNQLWEFDSTPGDVLLVDGRHTVIGCIDILSRRMKIQVSPTSKAESVSALMRRSILDWGVPESVKTDNGSDYVSRHIVQVLASLEIDHLICTPFSPEQKPYVERALGTFSHAIVELLPGYIGHNVADRKAIEARRSFADRLMKKGGEVEVKMTAAEFQTICDRWINAIYHQDPHSALGGKTPAQVAREWQGRIRRIENERALDLLLCPAADGGTRVIGKKGVQVGNYHYTAVEMAGHEGETVKVFLDRTDLGAVYLYRENGEFLCQAIEPTLAGVDRAEHAARLKAVQRQVMNESRKTLKKIAKTAAVETIYQEILEHREAKIAGLAEFPKRADAHTTPALNEASRAMESLERKAAGPRLIAITSEEEKGAQEIIDLAARKPRRPLFANDWERYEWLLDRLRAGDDLPDEDLAWMKRFEIQLDSGQIANQF